MPNLLVPPPPTGIGILDRWLALLWRKLTAAGEILWAQVSKAGSNLTDIETRNHADLQNLNTASYTHLTATQATDLTDAGDTLLHYHLRHDVTGVLTGGVLSVSVGGTTFSITDGTGQVIDNYTTPLTPTITPVSWSGKTNVTDTLLSEPANYILIDSAGAVVQQATAPTDDELRDKILIGVIAHANNLIIAFAPLVVSAYQNGNLAQDILSALGTITTGCTYAGNAALTFRRTSGSIFRRGAHYTLDAKTPNAVDLTAQDPAQFASYCRNGSNTVFSNSAVGTTLTANRYDDGTAAAAGIPNGVVNNNQWQAMRLFLSTNGFTLLQYGQQIYNSLDDVVAGVLSENWFQAPITRLTSFRGFLFVRGGASNLSSVSDAYFQPAGKLGDFAAASASPVFDHDHNAAGSGGVLTNDEHDGYSEYATSSTPATPASGKMAIFAEDAGGGVARLRAVHSTGSNLAFFRDSVIRVRNQSGSTILKAKAVYVTGATSGTPTVAPAKADAIATMPALGLLIADTANASFGTVQFCGLISNIDTSAFSEGARLYVSAATAGELTSTEPAHPNVSQVVGVVITANPTSGSIFIFPSADTVQGGQASEHYTLTSAEYIGTGTGVFARQNNTTLTGTTAATTINLSSNLSVNGVTTLGDSSTDTVFMTGFAAIGASGLSSAIAMYVSSDALAGNTQNGVRSTPLATSAATVQNACFRSIPRTAAAAFTNTTTAGLICSDASKGAGSTITNQIGVDVENQTQGTNNYGIRVQVSSGSNKWGFFESGTANNAYAGNSRFGGTTAPTVAVDVTGEILATTAIRSNGATNGIGYATGAGGTVTQLTSKATGVTLNKVCGQITTASDSLAANTRTSFTLTNSAIASTDSINIHRSSGGTANSYRIEVDSVAAGSCVIAITNITAGALSEAVVMTFSVMKSVTA